MIIETKKYELEISDEDLGKLFEELLKDFNKESNNQKSKYGIEFTNGGKEIILQRYIIKKIKFGGTISSLLIEYNPKENYFYFEGGIDNEIFTEIEPIIKNLNQRFLIELI